MQLSKQDSQQLSELIQHPGWKVFLRVLTVNKTELLGALYLCDESHQYHYLQRWKALETLDRAVKSLQTPDDIVQLGLDHE